MLNYVPAISFGRINPKTRQFESGRIISGEEAYDCYHLNLYLREVIKTRLSNDPLLRQDRNEFLRCIQTQHQYNGKDFSLTELGSSIGEIIDGFEFVRRRYFDNSQYNVEFHGIETSALFREVSKMLHPSVMLKLYESVDDYILYKVSSSDKKKYLFDRAVSSYAFSSTVQFSDFIKNFDICFLQICGFENEERVVEEKVGTQMQYFNLAELGQRLPNLNYLYGKRRPSRPKELDGNENCFESFYVYFTNTETQSKFKYLFLENSFFNNKMTQDQTVSPSNIKALISL